MIPYSNIFSDFLGRVTDYDFLNMDEEEFNELQIENLHKVIAQPYIRMLFSSITLDDEEAVIDYTLSNGEADDYFVTNMLAKGLVVEWLEPQVHNQVYVNKMIGTSKESNFSPANHLAQLRGMLSQAKLELQQMIRDYGSIYNEYINS